MNAPTTTIQGIVTEDGGRIVMELPMCCARCDVAIQVDALSWLVGHCAPSQGIVETKRFRGDYTPNDVYQWLARQHEDADGD